MTDGAINGLLIARSSVDQLACGGKPSAGYGAAAKLVAKLKSLGFREAAHGDLVYLSFSVDGLVELRAKAVSSFPEAYREAALDAVELLDAEQASYHRDKIKHCGFCRGSGLSGGDDPCPECGGDGLPK